MNIWFILTYLFLKITLWSKCISFTLHLEILTLVLTNIFNIYLFIYYGKGRIMEREGQRELPNICWVTLPVGFIYNISLESAHIFRWLDKSFIFYCWKYKHICVCACVEDILVATMFWWLWIKHYIHLYPEFCLVIMFFKSWLST